MVRKPFPFEKFFNDFGIPYVTSGQHCSRGNIAINCPFCVNSGKGDVKHHLGVSTSGKGWGCWRSGDHRGVSPYRLIREITGESDREVKQIIADYTGTTLDKFATVLETWNPVEKLEKKKEVQAGGLEWPRGFVLPDASEDWHLPSLDYLYSRGFPKKEVVALAEYYDLRITKDEYWRDRILIPFYDGDRLLGWSGRSIEQDPYLRWKMLPVNPGKDSRFSLESNNNHLANEKHIMQGGDVLVLSEGQFDFLKLDWYSKDKGVRATCMFSKTLSEEQAMLLQELTSRYKKVIIVLDKGTGLEALSMALKFPKVGQVEVPYGKDDLGELSSFEVRKFIRRIKE